MGLETATLIAIASTVSAGAAVAGGIQQSREAQKQAQRTQQETELQARAEARENIGLEKRQKLAFLKSGVALEGSPLLLLAETRRRGQENVGAISQTGRGRAKGIAASGRQALIGGFAQGLGTAAGGFSGFGGGVEDLGKVRTGKVPIPGRKPT